MFALWVRHLRLAGNQSKTGKSEQLMPNLGQPVTETTIWGRCGGEHTNRRCGGIDTRKLHGQSWQQGGEICRLHDSLRDDHLQRGPPIPGGPIEAQDQASENDSDSRQSERPSRDAGGDTSTNKICSSTHTVDDVCMCVYKFVQICLSAVAHPQGLL